MIKIHDYNNTRLSFEQFGENPNILIDSGIHGDEFIIIEPLGDYLRKNFRILPDLVYIPRVSPTALKNYTRKNADGVDLNRSFYEGTPESEAQVYMDLVSKFHFKVYLSFHEDLDQDNFYFYDTQMLEGAENLIKLRKDLIMADIKLYTGVDDPGDPNLGYRINQGYGYFGLLDRNDQTSGYWMAKRGIIERAIEIEIPSNSSLKQEGHIIDTVFKRLIIEK